MAHPGRREPLPAILGVQAATPAVTIGAGIFSGGIFACRIIQGVACEVTNMSIRSGQSITKLFTTRRFDTGVATNGDSLPAGTLYINGTADAATVTVTNITTGVYKAAVTLPTLAVGDVVDIRIAATVNSVADNAVIWSDSKAFFAGAVPDVIAGGNGGLLIAGSNAATTFAGLTTGALSCSTITASGAVAFQSTFAVTTSTSLAALSATTVTFSGAVAFQSTFAVTTSTSLAALSCTTLTASSAVAFQSTFATTGTVTFNAFTVTNNFLVSGTTTHTGAVAFGSTFGVTGLTTLTGLTTGAFSCTTLTASGAVAFQSTFATTGTTTFNAFTVTNATTLSGAVSLGSTLTVTGTTSLAALSTSGTTTLNALIVTNATSLTGAVTFGSTWNVTGAVAFVAGLTSNITGNLSGSVSSVAGDVSGSVLGNVNGYVSYVSLGIGGDVAGKVLGGGASSISGVGAWVLDSSGSALPSAAAIAVATRDVNNGSPAAGSLGEAVRGADAKAADLQITIGTPAVTVSADIVAVKTDTGNIVTKTNHLPDSDIVNTSGKLWVLDGSGNAVANQTTAAAIQAKTDLIPASPAAVGSAMTLATGAITETTITLPSEPTGPATGFLAKVMQLWNRFVGHKAEYNTNTSIMKTYAADGTTVVTTQSLTDVGGVQTQGPAT